MIHKTHKGEEQRQNIRADERAGENPIQLKLEYCKERNVGECVGGVDKEAQEVRDEEGVENVARYERGVADVTLEE
jgi:hypothetical protein